MTATAKRRSTAPSRRLPWWIRRGLRACLRGLRWWAGSPAPRARTVFGADGIGVLECEGEELAEHEERPRGCGWFDSSQDLREGLCVSEHAASDAVAAQLPVMAWVQLQLSGWRPTLTT